MVSSFDAVLSTILVIILGNVLFTFLIMLHIHASAKRRWNKNYKAYPYFHYSLLKKIFLLGLKGALNPIIVVLTFILHISSIFMIVGCIWIVISPGLVISYFFRVSLGLNGVVVSLRLFFYCAMPISLYE